MPDFDHIPIYFHYFAISILSVTTHYSSFLPSKLLLLIYYWHEKEIIIITKYLLFARHFLSALHTLVHLIFTILQVTRIVNEE